MPHSLAAQKGLRGPSQGYVPQDGLLPWSASGLRPDSSCMLHLLVLEVMGRSSTSFHAPRHVYCATKSAALVTQLQMPPWKGSQDQHLQSELHPPDTASGGKKGREALLEGAALPFSAPKSGFQVLPSKNFTHEVHSRSASPSEARWRRAVAACQAPAGARTPRPRDLLPSPC